LEELEEELADDKLIRHKSNWLRHVTRINNRMPKDNAEWTKALKTFEDNIKRG
jgi:hypothetical protein